MTEEITQKKYEALEVKKLPDSEIEITGEIPVAIVEKKRNFALKKLAENLDIPGFRKGSVPEDMALKHIGEAELLKEVAERTIGDAYADIVRDEKLEVVGRPSVTITKLAAGNPIGFKIQSAVYPKVTLPDYKKVATETRKKFIKKGEITVTDEDIENELKRLQQMMTPPTSADLPADKEGATAGKSTSTKVTAGKPEINDEFAKSLGGFESLDDLKSKMKEQMLQDKQFKEREKERIALAEAVIEKSTLETPNIFIEGELDQMVASFTDRVKKAGMELDAYLEQAGKTIEELRKEWRTDAEKRAKLQLIFNEIANKEKISPNPEKLQREIDHIKEHYPEAQEESVRVYVTSQMNNEKVFELLEGKEDTAKERKTEKKLKEKNKNNANKEEK
jgi:trigger factor